MYPLAPLQAGMLFHHMLNQTGDVYLEQARLAFASKAKLDEFLAALQAVINRHDILRTAIYWQGLPEPVQVVWRQAQLPVAEFNFSEEQGDIATQLQEHFDTSRFSLNLQQAPLMQAGFAYDAQQQRWQLVMVNHHLAVDHTAMEILLAEIQAYLQGLFSDLPAALPYRNYVAQALISNNDAAHENYFKNLLADVDETSAPLGLTDTQLNGSELTEVRLELVSTVAASLRDTARHLGVSAASICHVAWARALASLSGRDDVVFGTVLFGRMQAGAGADRVLGMFINTLPVRMPLRDLDCRASVLQMHHQLNELLAHEHAPLSLAQSCSSVVAPAPLFTALLNYRYSITEPEDAHTPDAWQGIEMFDTAEQTNYPCVLSVDDLGAGFRLTAQVVGTDNAERVLAAMHRSLQGLVAALTDQQQITVMAIDVVSEQEKQQLLYDWNNTACDFPQHESIAEQFAKQVQLSPDAKAVTHNDKTWTYAELDRQANSLAKQLYSIGVGRTTNVVAILLERSFELVVAQLAVLKCGAAYLPLDLSMPDERLQFVTNDSGAPIVITTSKLELPSTFDLLRIDLDTESLIEDSTFDFDSQSTGDSTAYIMYTSGSTGQPKGVKIAHRGISRLVINNGYLPFSANDRVAFAANPAFDASTMEVWGPLLNGGSLVVIDKAAFLQPQQFAQVLQEQQITVLFITSALFNQYANTIPEALAQVKYLLTGGERGDVSSFAKVLQAGGNNHLIHCYGPTETTTFAITHRVTDIPEGAKSIPLGKPIANTRIYILDSVGQPVPVGVTGEIYIGGAGVALGYLDRPELTAERFLADPYATEQDALMYKTGDLAYWRTDGCIEFVGRNDFQVKIRGFRIELGEIEARLAAHPELHEVLVMAREDQQGEKRLVVYYSGAETVDAEVLRQWLSESLPDYMIPAAYVKLSALPVNANGKVDRKALPAPDSHAFAQRSYEEPQGEVEQQLAELWQDLLKMDQIGRLDNFFELGGHSLLAVQLMLRIQQDFAVELSLQDIFLQPVLQQLAECIVDKQLAEFDLDDLTELAALLNETDSVIGAGE
jgi:amino acid adenylation domain-containing protein